MSRFSALAFKAIKLLLAAKLDESESVTSINSF